MSDTTLAGLVARKAESRHTPVLHFLRRDSDSMLQETARTYAELDLHGAAIADGLVALGLEAGDHVGLLAVNEPAFVETMLACGRLGAIFVPLDPTISPRTLSHRLRFADCRGLVCTPATLATAALVADSDPALAWVAVVADPHDEVPTEFAGRPLLQVIRPAAAKARDGVQPPPLAPKNGTMFLLYAGRSDDAPAVIQTHRHAMAFCTGYASVGLDPACDRIYAGLPLHHVHGQTILRNSLALGVPAVFDQGFQATEIWDLCRRHGCTAGALPASTVEQVHAAPSRSDESSGPVRRIFTSGMPTGIWRDFERRFRVRVYEGYGGTVAGGMLNPGIGPIGSIGQPWGGWEAAILDDAGSPLGPGQVGEICMRPRHGRAIDLRYYKNPEATAAQHRAGWLRMGDLGHRDVLGWYWLDQRGGVALRSEWRRASRPSQAPQ